MNADGCTNTTLAHIVEASSYLPTHPNSATHHYEQSGHTSNTDLVLTSLFQH
jgi:hypothetical protein